MDQTTSDDTHPDDVSLPGTDTLGDPAGPKAGDNLDGRNDQQDTVSGQKPVNFGVRKTPSNVGALVYAKQHSMYIRSILSNSLHLPEKGIRAKTLLNEALPTEQPLKSWKQADEFTKLAAAAGPLYSMAQHRGWELKTFTLVLNQQLHDRLDRGDPTALVYIRDQMTRLVRSTVSPNAEFLYGVEKAPAALSARSSRRRWHLHGLMIGPPGFSASGKTPLRLKLRALKGDEDTDLMFRTPGKKIERSELSSAMSWCFYAVKNGLSLDRDPNLRSEYEAPPGKHSFLSPLLRREAKRWHDGMRSNATALQLVAGAPKGIYGMQ
jgi:hypothetical protein